MHHNGKLYLILYKVEDLNYMQQQLVMGNSE